MEKANLGLILLLKSNSAVFTVENTVWKLITEIIFLLLQTNLFCTAASATLLQTESTLTTVRIIKDGGIFGFLVPPQAHCA